MSAVASSSYPQASGSTFPSSSTTNHPPAVECSSEPEEGEVEGNAASKRFWDRTWNAEVREQCEADEETFCDCYECEKPFKGEYFISLSEERALCPSCWDKRWEHVPDIQSELPQDILHSISLAQLPTTTVEKAVFSAMCGAKRDVILADLLIQTEAIFRRWRGKEGDEQEGARGELNELLAQREAKVAAAALVYDATHRAFLKSSISRRTQLPSIPIADEAPLASPSQSSPPIVPPAPVSDDTTFNCNGCPASFKGPPILSSILPFNRVGDLLGAGDLRDVLPAVKLPIDIKAKEQNLFWKWLTDHWWERGRLVHQVLTDEDIWADYGKHRFRNRGLRNDDDNEEDNGEALGPASGAVCRPCALAIFLAEIFPWWRRHIQTSAGYVPDGEDAESSNPESSGGDGPAPSMAVAVPSGAEFEVEDVHEPEPESDQEVGLGDPNPEDPANAAANIAGEEEHGSGGEPEPSVTSTAAELETGLTSDEALDFEEEVILALTETDAEI